MSGKSERRAAREAIAVYHEARLTELVQRVGDAVDRFRDGEIDAFEIDQVIYQYSRAAKELWKFSSLPEAEFTAGTQRRSVRLRAQATRQISALGAASPNAP